MFEVLKCLKISKHWSKYFQNKWAKTFKSNDPLLCLL